MKRSLAIVAVLFVMLSVIATPVFASASSLGSDVYSVLSKYGMTVADKQAMDEYVKNYNVTDAQAAQVLDYANGVAEEFEKNNTTNPGKLSQASINNIKSYAYAAADVVGAKINVTKNGNVFTVTILDSNNKPVYTTSARLNSDGSITRIQPFTGSSAVVTVISIVAVMAVAGVVTLKLRKEA